MTSTRNQLIAVGLCLIGVAYLIWRGAPGPELLGVPFGADPSASTSEPSPSMPDLTAAEEIVFQATGDVASPSLPEEIAPVVQAIAESPLLPDARGREGVSGNPVTSAVTPRAASRQHPGKQPAMASYRRPAEVLAGQDLSDPVVRARVVAQMQTAEDARYAAVLEKAEDLGIPVRIEGPGRQLAILHDFDGDDPIYRRTLNRNAAISSAANLVGSAPYNLNGTGIKVGVWDAGSVRATHQEFASGRVTNRNPSAFLDDHATHVAGTIAARGATASARGMATNVWVDAYDWNSDYAEMTAAGAATALDTNRLPISNHSYGYNVRTSDMGRYNGESRDTDAVVYSLPYYLPFWAAGNEQDVLTAKNGYQSITYNALSKNLVVVGAVNDAVTSGSRDISMATMSWFSSWGPADDGRIKPDIVANGVSVNSPIDTSNTAYDSYDGTSMASPSAAGSAALLVQLYRRELGGRNMLASTLKALLIHTADDLGTPGPDYRFGWGLINTKAAADVILAHRDQPRAPKIIETNLTSSATSRSFSFVWDGNSPIRATLVWTDPAGTARSDNDRNPVLVHNLDLRVVAPNGVVHEPYVMPFVGNWSDAAMSLAAVRGSNRVDNVERVDIPAPSLAGTYTATVSLGGSLTTSSQAFSLVLTGSIGSDIPPQFEFVPPVVVVSGRPVSFAVVATDPADNDPITLTATSLPAGSTFNSSDGSGTFIWNEAEPNGIYLPRFVATDKDGSVTQTVTITVMDNAPPILEPIGDRSILVGNLLTFGVDASDPIGGDPITLTATNLPVGATFNAAGGSGTFTWANPSPVGAYPVTFTAEDLAGSVSETIYITVQPAPVFVYGTNSAAIVLNEVGAATPYPSTINISGVEGTVERVIVKLNGFTHTWPDDMEIILVGPEGQKSVIMGAVGGGTSVSGLNLVFDDLAGEELSEPLISGTWRPSGSIVEALPAPAPGLPYDTALAGFVGTSPNGTWSLYASDYQDFDDGSISGGWSLELEVLVPTNTAPTISVINPAPIPVGSNFELLVTANDLTDNDVIALSADPLPPGAVFASVTNAGTVAGTMIWNNAGPTGEYVAVFRATDKDGSRTRTVPFEVFLPPPPAPAALWISSTNNNGFTAEWSSAPAAGGYRLDVSTSAAFENLSEIGTPTTVFYHPGPPGSGTGGVWLEENVSGTTYLIMTSSGSRVTGPTVSFAAGVTDSLAFQARTYGGVKAANNRITVSISTNAGSSWTVLGTRTPLSNTLSAMEPFDISAYDGKDVTIKFETLGAGGGRGAGIRQMELQSLVYEVVADYVPDYSNRTVNATSEVVTGLTPNQTYYARVRAVNEGGVSPNSATASVTTTFSPEPPIFTSPTGPFTNQTGLALSVPLVATGLPEPAISLTATTASGGYSFADNTLTYTPPLADIGERTFDFVATNAAGSATHTVTVIVTEGPPAPPATVWASGTNATAFTAAWSEVSNADSYRLDVSTSATFAISVGSGNLMVNPGFESGNASGWNKVESGYAISTVNPRSGTYHMRCVATATRDLAQQVAIPVADGSTAYTIRYWYRVSAGDGTDVRIWANWNNGAGSGDTLQPGTYNATVADWTEVVLTNTPAAGATSLNFEVRVYSGATVDLDDFSVSSGSGGGPVDEFVPGFEDLTVAATSQVVTGLTEGVTYYFRARAVNEAGTSPNSPTGSVVTAESGDGDINDDGIPDAWFLFYGLDPAIGAADLLPGTDTTYLEVFMLDADPTLPLSASFNRITESDMEMNGTISLTIDPSSTGRVYDVHWRNDLDDNQWNAMGLDLPGTDGPLTLTITNEVPTRFYRTGVNLP